MELEFKYFHLYNRLVRRQLVKPLACRHCDNPFTLRADENDQPVLRCYFCSTTVLPGLDLYRQVRAVVKEHFSNDQILKAD